MATFTIDLLTGNLYLFNGDFTSSGSTPTSGSTYPQVSTFASLPSAALSSGEVYLVRNSSGTGVLNRKPAGLYYSNGSVWRYLGDTPDAFKSENFQIIDSTDNTKGVMFETSGLTSGNYRKIKVQDSDGTIAYLTDIGAKVDTSVFDNYTGTTAPNTYLNISTFDTYTGTTATAIGLKANIASPTLTGIPEAPTAVANTSTTQIATTAYVLGQAANANPLMDSTVSIGTSLRYAREDHKHASDTSRVAKAGDTMTGALVINSNLNVTGNVSITGSTYLGNITPDVNQQNFSVVDITTKKVADSGTKFHVYGTEFYYAQNLAGTTTTAVDPAYETMLTINTAVVPAGTYRVMTSFQGGNGSTNNDVMTRVQVDGTTLGTWTNFELPDVNTYVQQNRMLFITFATAASHTITSQFANEKSGTLTLYDNSMEFIRVS
ncbi:MAG: hypothetical protein PF487_00715 [Bacteroidales bacterium]|jgi:hypothetical protein|nr:hypothetical protein [Bacteroidales bacterium]